MFIFPVGKQKKLRKLPWITLLLITANIFIFMSTWPDTLRFYEELSNVNSKIDTQKSTIEQIKSEIESLSRQQKDLSDLKSNTYRNRYYASYYLQQNQSIDQQLVDKQTHLTQIETEVKKLEATAEELKPQIPFLQYGYIASKQEPWRLITHQFLHSGYMHLIFNMFFLWFVGCNLEDKWGKWYFLGFYLVCGVVAALANEFFMPSGDIPLVGASGAIAGAMGAFMVRYPKTKVKVFYLFFFGFLFKMGFADWPSVAYWAHVGGFAFGAIVAVLMNTTGFEKKYIEPNIEKEEKELLGVSSKVLDAKETIEEGNDIKAEEMLRGVIKSDPSVLEAYVTLLGVLKKYHSMMTDEMKGFVLKILELAARKNDELTELTNYYNHRELVWPQYSLTLKTLMFLARILEAKGDFLEAANIYSKIINEYSNDPLSNKAFYGYAKVAIQQGQKEKALEILKRLLVQPEGYHYQDRVAELLASLQLKA